MSSLEYIIIQITNVFISPVILLVCYYLRTFSKLKVVKNLCRSRTSDERLEELMFMTCEKDITDEIPVHNLATLWASLKSRRIAIAIE